MRGIGGNNFHAADKFSGLRERERLIRSSPRTARAHGVAAAAAMFQPVGSYETFLPVTVLYLSLGHAPRRTNVRAQTINLAPERTGHAATTLPSGKVLITGGVNENTSPFRRAPLRPGNEDFHPDGVDDDRADQSHFDVIARWARPDRRRREHHRFEDGGVLRPGDRRLHPDRKNMKVARTQHTATVLQNGQVLLVGGQTAELFDPVAELYDDVGTPVNRRSHARAPARRDGLDHRRLCRHRRGEHRRDL